MRVTGEPSIIPLAEIPQTAFDGSPDLWSVAQDLQDICADPANQDLLLGFRPTVEAYSKPLNAVRERLLARQRKAQEHPDQFQSFLALVPQEYEQDVKIPSRLVVVGLGIITVLSEERVPKGINPAWPNLSSLISAPFRGQGIGGLLLRSRLTLADEQFEGAWTSVRPDNTASQGNVLKAGFRYISQSVVDGVLENHYIRPRS